MNRRFASFKTILENLTHLFPSEFIYLTSVEQRVSVATYRLLAAGQPVSSEAIAQNLHLSREVVTGVLDRWPGVFYDDQRQVIGYWGLALPTMAHRFQVNGRTLYTWCAWDGLFIPEILAATAQIHSVCPVTKENIWLEVGPEGIQQHDPANTVMSFVTPEAARLRENILEHFCHYVHFFTSAEAGARWVADHKDTFILSLDEALQLACEKNRIQYQKVLSLVLEG